MSGSRKRKAVRAEPEEDWRSTLFFWRGELRGGAWEGAWVGSRAPAAPSAAQFAASASAFAAALTPPAPAAAAEAGLSCSVASRYHLDQGDGRGLQEFADDAHHLVVAAGGLAAAAGANCFGAFVAVGHVTAGGGAEGSGGVLTLARRYVREGDARARLRGEQGARAVLQQYALPAAAGGEGGEPAWLAALSRFVQGEKRQRSGSRKE